MACWLESRFRVGFNSDPVAANSFRACSTSSVFSDRPGRVTPLLQDANARAKKIIGMKLKTPAFQAARKKKLFLACTMYSFLAANAHAQIPQGNLRKRCENLVKVFLLVFWFDGKLARKSILKRYSRPKSMPWTKIRTGIRSETSGIWFFPIVPLEKPSG